MALGTTDITTTIVKNALGEDQNAVYHLTDSPNINKWSKYKPVQGTWPQSNGYYGLNLPTNWDYVSITNNGRLGDFRGYEHSQSLAFPTMHIKSTEISVQNLHPTAGPTTNTWKIRTYNAASDVLITPSNLGYENYYYGIKIWGNGVVTSYRTIGAVNAGSASGIDFSIQANYDENAGSFYDLPLGSGTYNYQFFISSNATTWNGSRYVWTNIPRDNMINLVNEGSFISYGTFEVSQFIYVDNSNLNFSYGQSGAGSAIRVHIGSSDRFKYTSVPESNAAGWSIKDVETFQIVNNQEGISGNYIDVYPNSNNTSYSAKTEDVILTLLNDSSVSVTINFYQSATPPFPVSYVVKITSDPWGYIADSVTLNEGVFNVPYDFTHTETTNTYGPYNVTVFDQNEVSVGYVANLISIEPELPHLTGLISINRATQLGDSFEVRIG